MKTVIIYHSQYGTTKQHALWISEQMKADIFDIKNMNQEHFEEYEYFIILSGMQYNRIRILPLLKKYRTLLKGKDISFILCTIDTTKDQCALAIEKFLKQKSTVYVLPGFLNVNNLSFWDTLQFKVTALLNPQSSFLKALKSAHYPTRDSVDSLLKQIKR